MGVKYMRIKNIYIYTHTHTHTHTKIKNGLEVY
jgi:hypothetical protein